jgi:WD40 repeat protein
MFGIINKLTSQKGVSRYWLLPVLLCLFHHSFVQADDSIPFETMLGLETSGHNGHVTRLIIDRHRSHLISVSHDKTIRLWDLRNYEPVRTLRPPIGRGMVGELYSASLSPDGRLLAVSGFTAPEGTTDHTVLLISLPEGKLVRRLHGNTLPVQDVAFSPDGKWLAAGGTDGMLRLWNTSTWTLDQALLGHTARIDSLAWAPDSTRLVTGSWDGTCRFWSLATGTSSSVMTHGGFKVYCVAWSPNGQSVATGGGDDWVKLWDPQGNLQRNLAVAGKTIETVAFSPDSAKLLYGFGGGQTNVLGGAMVRVADSAVLALYAGHLDTVMCSTFSPDGKYAIFGDCDDHICVWEADTGRLAARIRSEGNTIYATGWNMDGHTIACGYSHLPGSSLHATNPLQRTFLLDRLEYGPPPTGGFMRAQTQWGALSIHRTSMQRATVSQNGYQLSQYYDPTISIRSRTLLSNNRAAIGCDQNLIVYDILTGRPIYRLPGHLDAVWAVTPSPDQRHLLTGSDDETLHIWNLERYEHTLSLFFAGDEWIAWTPQGYYAASAGGENFMGWHVQQGYDQMATFHPASRFHERFYRPDLIRRIVPTGGPVQALKEMDRLRGSTTPLIDIKSSLPPQVQLSYPANVNGPTADGSVQVQAVAHVRTGDSIRSLRLFIDGRPGPETHDAEVLAAAPAPESVVAGGGLQSRFNWTVTLLPGKHRLTAKALSTRSAGLSEDLDVNYALDRAGLPRLFVIAMGISAYERPDLRRTFPAADAQAIATEFGKASPSAFSEVQVHLLQDQQVTRQELDSQFQWLQQNMTANDVCCIYFGGRGERDAEGTLYLQHQDSRPGDPAAGLSESNVATSLQKTAGKVVLLLDVMDGVPPNAAADRRTVDDFVRLLGTEEYGVTAISAVSGREVPRDMPSGGHGVFGQAILNALEGKADSNSDRTIDIKEFSQFVRTNVKNLTSDAQRPAVSHPSLVHHFPIYK